MNKNIPTIEKTNPLRKFWANFCGAFIANKSKRRIVRERILRGIYAMRNSNVDFAVSAGGTCRVAYYLRLLGLRKFSAPFDWLTGYDLDAWFLALEKGGIENILVHWEEITSDFNGKERAVKDTDTGLLALHEFSMKSSVVEQMPEFREKMRRRSEKLRRSLDSAKNVGIVIQRNLSDEELLGFAEKLSSLYPGLKFRLLNTLHRPEEERCPHPGKQKEWRLIRKTESYILAQAAFFDYAFDVERNCEDWHGNATIWPQAIKEFFKKNSEIDKMTPEKIS